MAIKNLVKIVIVKLFIKSNHIDVLEMDAASKTGVDDVRDLIEFSRYGPTSKYKIFIIDEVHMLSKQAFNALLKTLEPPNDNISNILKDLIYRELDQRNYLCIQKNCDLENG